KWRPGSADYDTTPPKYPADISPRMASRLGVIATAAYRLLGCRDYARVDFRMKPNGRPFILEVNPNPEISATAGFAGCLGSAKILYQDFIVRLVRHALNRPKGPVPNFAMEQALSLQPAS